MRIAVLGAGALGSVIGARLKRAGLETVLLARNAAHREAIARDGLQLEEDGQSTAVSIPAMAPEQLDRADLVVLLTKTYDSDAALAAVRPALGQGAFVLSLQNGLGNGETLARHVPKDRILLGCTMANGVLAGPGHVSTRGSGRSVFSALAPSDRTDAIAAALDPAGIELTAQAPALIWQKAAFNCAMNASGLLGEGRVGAIAEHIGPDLAARVAAEAIALAHAQGAKASLKAVEQQLSHAMAHHAGHVPSMLQDLRAGKPTEIESLNGYVARRAADCGLDAPLNALLAGLVRMKTAARLGKA